MLRASPILLTFLIIPFALSAQQLIFKTYTVQDGLVANPVHRIYQDSKGFIWIATWEGLSKYDGNKFTNFTVANGLSNNVVNDIIEIDGRLFVASNSGNTDIIENDMITRKDVLGHIVINRFHISRNHRVFALTDTSGINELVSGRLRKPQQQNPNASYSRMIDYNDSLLAICSPEIPLRIVNPSFQSVAEAKSTISVNECIFKDSHDRLWVGTQTGLRLLIFQYDSKPRLQFIQAPAPISDPRFIPTLPNDLIEESNGNLWIATQKGLIRIKPNGAWNVYTERDGLPANNIICLYQDKENNIWIGTSRGLAKLATKNNIQIFTEDNGLPNNDVSAVLITRDKKLLVGGPWSNSIWFQQYDPALNSFNIPDLKYASLKYKSITWQLTLRGHQIDESDISLLSLIQRVPESTKYSAFCITTGINKIMIGTAKGIIMVSKNNIDFDTTVPYRISCLLLTRNGALWIGTWENGLYRLIPDAPPGKRSLKNYSSILPAKHIRSLFEDGNGNIWVGTRHNGAFQLINDGNSLHVQSFDQRQGIMSNWIRAINEDADGSIWLGSYTGLDKLIRTPSGFRIFNFSRINNFSRTVNDIICSGKDQIWCGTTEGLVNITDERTEQLPPLAVYLSSISLAGNPYDAGKPAETIALKNYQNQVNFEFTAPGFINEKQILYSYRLSGSIDTAWSVPSNLHNVSYASLQPGNYKFQVRTIGWNGEYGAPTAFSFTISPPFWRSWWFYVLATVLGIALIVAIYRYRIKQLLQLQKVRNRIATDLHDDIGSTLTNISILSELSHQSLKQPGQAEKFLQRISEEVTSSSQALDDIIWSVNTRNDSLEETLARMRRYAAELFDNNTTRCHLELDKNIYDKKLNMEQRRDIFLMYKESLNNVFKHASATNVWITAVIERNHLHLKIKDDGKGFDTRAATHRNGWKNLRSRVEKWKGKLQLVSEKGNGTSVVIELPV